MEETMMTKREFERFLVENRKRFEQAAEEFDKHSQAFDQKIREILAAL